jgi:hypothetical protein
VALDAWQACHCNHLPAVIKGGLILDFGTMEGPKSHEYLGGVYCDGESGQYILCCEIKAPRHFACQNELIFMPTTA